MQIYIDLIVETLKQGPKTKGQVLEALKTGRNREIILSRLHDEAIRLDLGTPGKKSVSEWVSMRWNHINGKIFQSLSNSVLTTKEPNNRYTKARIQRTGEIYYLMEVNANSSHD